MISCQLLIYLYILLQIEKLVDVSALTEEKIRLERSLLTHRNSLLITSELSTPVFCTVDEQLKQGEM